MKNDFISKDNILLVNLAMHEIKSINKDFNSNGVWVCIGSLPVNLNNNKSDIDLLFFSNENTIFKKQKGIKYNTSAYMIPTTMLLEDCTIGKYGGYLAAKLFNPFYVVENSDVEVFSMITSAPALYFYPFIEYYLSINKLELTFERLSAMALKSFFDQNQYFIGWWIKNWASDCYDDIWRITVNQFKESLKSIGALPDLPFPKRNNKTSSLKMIRNNYEYKAANFEQGVNHWGFCIISHDCDYSFLYWARDKSQNYIDIQGGYNGKVFKSMIKELSIKSGLLNI